MDMTLLKAEIEGSGIPIVEVAKNANIKRGTLYYRFEHPETWRVNEMVGIITTLQMPKHKQVEIFGLK